jgi:hypothetical protein
MHKLVEAWNQIESELEARWKSNNKPHGAVWKRLATALWERQRKIEDSLAPLLLEWAEKNGCGKYRAEVNCFGLVGWRPQKNCYKKIVEHTGIKASSQRIRWLLEHAGWLAGGEEAVKRANKQEWEDAYKFVCSMPDAEFDKYMAGFCTASTEGKNTYNFVWEIRIAYLKERTAQQRKADMAATMPLPI